VTFQHKKIQQSMNILGIIPARYASTRFPGKPLVDIKGKTMIRRVFENCKESINDVIVATDNSLIEKEVNQFGGSVIITSENHKSGTDRCAEALEKYEKISGKTFDIVINIQGDEPFIHKDHLTKLIACFNDSETEIATLISKTESNADIFNPNKPKVIIDNRNYAIYFSRSPIPYLRGIKKEDWHLHHTFYQHLGIYAYRNKILKKITKLPVSGLEIAESLEQNRWLENGFKIKTDITLKKNISVDTPEDLEQLIKMFF